MHPRMTNGYGNWSDIDHHSALIKRKRSERSLPQRPCVVGQQVWSAKPSQTAKRSRPPCACHMGEESFLGPATLET